MAMKKSTNDKLARIIKQRSVIRGNEREIITAQGGFKTRKSAWIIDMRATLLHPDALNIIAEEFWNIYKDKYPFQVCGLEIGAIPLVTAIVMHSQMTGKPVNGFIVRKERKKNRFSQSDRGSHH
jgi:orotate phosphoribosyltransferase